MPLYEARRKALEAADRRRRLNDVMGGPGRKLGGGIETKRMTPREAAAWVIQSIFGYLKRVADLLASAAERRVKDEKTCGSVSVETVRQEAEKALEESISNTSPSSSSVSVLPLPSGVLTQPTPTSSLALKSTQKANQHVPNSIILIRRTRTSPSPDARPSKRPRISPSPAIAQRLDAPSSEEWPCPTCTLLNRTLAVLCSVCVTIRPLARGADWLCLGCGEEANKARFWTCKGCGKMKTGMKSLADSLHRRRPFLAL